MASRGVTVTRPGLLLMYDDLISSFDKSLQSDMAILDFSLVFAIIPHSRLLSKLTPSGVIGQVLTWIDMFHSDRKITEMVNGHTANESISPVWCTPGHSSRFPIFPGLHQWHQGPRLQKHYNPSICKWLFIVLTPEENNKDEDQGWLQCDLTHSMPGLRHGVCTSTWEGVRSCE